MANQVGYIAGSKGSGSASGDTNHDRRKKEYLSYLDLKTEEIKEQKDGRRYYHGAQWTEKQIKTFNGRRQPIVTYNRIGRKINAIVGLLERQKQDPRAYPRTPEQDKGAEVATAVLRYVCDEQRWAEKSPVCGLNGAVDGIGGAELLLEPGDRGDMDVGLEIVDPSGFFYDPRSLKQDFSDARYMGFGRWADLDSAIEAFPQKEAELRASVERGSELTSNPDWENKWFSAHDGQQRIRIVDHWYIDRGEWRWCVYTGSDELASGVSPFKDEKGKTFCKFVMFSAAVDQDGDRYGFVRNMKSSQDEINQRRSKGLHIANTRRVIATAAAIQAAGGVEKVRQEGARPDGVLVVDGIDSLKFEDAQKGQELQAQLGFLADAKAEIENYGFNPALIGTGVQQMSGRAIQLQQQAGVAELGPYMLAYKGWKLRVYRAIWNIVQRYWSAERWIRVTDDEDVARFMAVNRLGIDPRTGLPTIVNALGSLDVDIILDEGPDNINMQADAYDTLTVLARGGMQVPPELLLELSPLAGSVKKRAMDALEKGRQPNPVQQQGVMLELQGKQADNAKKMADARLSMARAASEGRGQSGADPASIDLEWRKALLSSLTSLEVARIAAKTDADSAALDAKIETLLGLSGLANDQAMQVRDHAHQQAMAQINPPQPQAA